MYSSCTVTDVSCPTPPGLQEEVFGAEAVRSNHTTCECNSAQLFNGSHTPKVNWILFFPRDLLINRKTIEAFYRFELIQLSCVMP